MGLTHFPEPFYSQNFKKKKQVIKKLRQPNQKCVENFHSVTPRAKMYEAERQIE